ncbi:MAG TPA: hypothetical protein VFG10_13460 [Saprospiraceae bacterium]|nr:hypothetical protein [Saprospiraceae bacterium]
MNKNFIKTFGLALSMMIVCLFTACQKDEVVTDVDNFVLLSTRGIESASGLGITGCYELVFPVTVQFSDSTTAEVADYAALKQAIRDWFVANGAHPKPNRPTLVYPIQVINQAGEIIDVASPQAMKDLIALCKPVHGGGGHHNGGGPDSLNDHHNGPGGPCFRIVFPVTISFPDSTQVIVNSPRELGQAAKTWNKNNPGQHARPELVFPITVTLKDGTQVVVNSKEELSAIKDVCRG